jgi:hypothetical protein
MLTFWPFFSSLTILPKRGMGIKGAETHETVYLLCLKDGVGSAASLKLGLQNHFLA